MAPRIPDRGIASATAEPRQPHPAQNPRQSQPGSMVAATSWIYPIGCSNHVIQLEVGTTCVNVGGTGTGDPVRGKPSTRRRRERDDGRGGDALCVYRSWLACC